MLLSDVCFRRKYTVYMSTVTVYERNAEMYLETLRKISLPLGFEGKIV